MEHYFERNLVINNKELVYKGIFRADELFSAINRALEEKGYEKREKKTEEIVTESGRKTYVELRPFKEKTNYAKFVIKIKITLDNVNEKVETINDVKRKYHLGDVEVLFDAWILTGYADMWGMKPWVYFLKGIINKYLYTFPLESGFTGEVTGDTVYIFNKVKKLLRSYRAEDLKHTPEEEVMKSMEKEIKKKKV